MPQFLQKNPWLSFLVFTLLTILALLQGQISVFYIIYLFWWEELIRIVVNAIYNRKYQQKEKVTKEPKSIEKYPLLSSVFMLGIYLIFLIVFFGIVANWKNQNILVINVEVMLFRNWFFNINLIFIVINQINFRQNIKQFIAIEGAFTPNMIVLHISIIFGAILHFVVLDKFSDWFASESLWGSVVIILPFLVLRYFMQNRTVYPSK